jgi:hypothetical protein
MSLRAAILAATVGWVAASHAQSFWPNLEAERLQAHLRLREAIIGLRDIRAVSCRRGTPVDCDLAALNDVELTLLDIEWKYQRYEKAKSAADQARQTVDGLIDLLNKP